jgi:DNA polymerase-3 subunit alpha
MLIRAIGKVYGFSEFIINSLSNEIEIITTRQWSLQDHYDNNQKLRELVDSEPRFQKLLEHSKVLENIPFSYGTHAGGIVIIPDKNLNKVNVQVVGDCSTLMATKDELSFYGLLKFDILAVDALTIISFCLKKLKLGLSDIPIDDKSVFQYI